jgi:hypothetical protein
MVVLAAHTALENIGHAKLPSYLAHVFVFALELKGRGATDDLQA